MRSSKMNGYTGDFHSSFLSCEKDTEEIIKKLFVESKPYSDELKRLLLINNPDCLRDTTNQVYIDTVKKTSLSDLREGGYIKFIPKLPFGENEETKSYISISFDNFSPNMNNPYYRDCTVIIDVLCNMDSWDMDNYKLRPIQIVGLIDGILNGCRLSGIGTLQFMGCNELVLSENLAGYCLMYSAVHGVEDAIPVEDEE